MTALAVTPCRTMLEAVHEDERAACGDIAIVGAGVGGATLAWALRASGARVLVIEQGGFLPRERENWSARAVHQLGRYKNSDPWIDGDGEAFVPGDYHYVGGSSKLYGATMPRLREEDFGEVELYDGVSPAWPVSYADMEPYYAEAERLYWYSAGPSTRYPLGNVHGLGKLQGATIKARRAGGRLSGCWSGSRAAASTSSSSPKTCRCRRTASRSTAPAHPSPLAADQRRGARGARTPDGASAAPRGLSVRVHATPGNGRHLAPVRDRAHGRRCRRERRRPDLYLDNLWIVDASVFPSSAAVNPALTMAAAALRVARAPELAGPRVGTRR